PPRAGRGREVFDDPPRRALRGDRPQTRLRVQARRERARPPGGRGAADRAGPDRSHEGAIRRAGGKRMRGTPGGFDMNKLLKQAQQMQADMQKAQEELADAIVEASAGGGMVTVKATGAGELTEIKIDPKAIDPDDPEFLEDAVLAAVNEALRSAQSLAQSRLGGMM